MTLPDKNGPEYLRGLKDAQTSDDKLIYVFPDNDYQSGWNAGQKDK